jgi:hypothetical protein
VGWYATSMDGGLCVVDSSSLIHDFYADECEVSTHCRDSRAPCLIPHGGFFFKKFSVAVLPLSVVFVLFLFLDVAGPSRPPSLSSHIYVPPAAQALNHLKRPSLFSCTVSVCVFLSFRTRCTWWWTRR